MLTTNAAFTKLNEWLPGPFVELLSIIQGLRSPVYLVGGTVRDRLLGRTAPPVELDLALRGPVLDLARQAADEAGWAFYPLDADRDVARLVLAERADDAGPRLICDVAALRGSLENDLHTRDFTINSLAVALEPDQEPELIDLIGGLDDLQQRRLRVVDEANLDTDPVRLLRAIRFAHAFSLEVEPSLAAAIRRRGPSLSNVTAERRRDELWKIMALPRPGDALESTRKLDLLPHVLPALSATVGVQQTEPHHLDVYRHTRLAMNYAAQLRDWVAGTDDTLSSAVKKALAGWQSDLQQHFGQTVASGHSRAAWLVWHALFHDVGKPHTANEVTRNGCRRIQFHGHEKVSAELCSSSLAGLHFSRKETALCRAVVNAHMRPHHLFALYQEANLSRRARFRFVRDTDDGSGGPRTGVDVLMLALADRLAISPAKPDARQPYLQFLRESLDDVFQYPLRGRQPLVDGNQLIQSLDLSPGPQIGYLLDQLQEAHAAGEIETPEEALNFAETLIASNHGAHP